MGFGSGQACSRAVFLRIRATLLGFSFLFGAVVLMRMRAELARAKAEARLRRRLSE